MYEVIINRFSSSVPQSFSLSYLVLFDSSFIFLVSPFVLGVQRKGEEDCIGTIDPSFS